MKGDVSGAAGPALVRMHAADLLHDMRRRQGHARPAHRHGDDRRGRARRRRGAPRRPPHQLSRAGAAAAGRPPRRRRPRSATTASARRSCRPRRARHGPPVRQPAADRRAWKATGCGWSRPGPLRRGEAGLSTIDAVAPRNALRTGPAAAPPGDPGAVLRAGGGRHAPRRRGRVRRGAAPRRRWSTSPAPSSCRRRSAWRCRRRHALRRLPRPRLRGARRDRPLRPHLPAQPATA